MVESESTDGSATFLGASCSDEHCVWEPKSLRSSITMTNFNSEQSLNSTDPGEDSVGRFHKRRYSDLSWPEALRAQGLNQRLEVVWEELDKALAPCDLRHLRPKPCPTVLDAGKSSLRLRRTAGLR